MLTTLIALAALVVGFVIGYALARITAYRSCEHLIEHLAKPTPAAARLMELLAAAQGGIYYKPHEHPVKPGRTAHKIAAGLKHAAGHMRLAADEAVPVRIEDGAEPCRDAASSSPPPLTSFPPQPPPRDLW